MHTSKGRCCLAKGNSDVARIEFNRADDRSRRAVDYCAEDIRTQREAAQSGPANVASVRRNAESREFRAVLEDRYGDSAGWAVYADYIVTASTYLHGLYFLAAGNGQSDIARAFSSSEPVARLSPAILMLATVA